ncbi:GAF domain-containing sensor histidine kinase [Nocardioides sp. GY 10127]|uniref:sensor histidine kinase n=1 Tax=Nocardioides sp. GY 10127 TaxID=2569762 RepID=UPI0010A7C57D|nr:GAF domain-containing sensor histidine kinase [Nocardioides sp. GY 10127]TIC80918.1 GAF domain-containing sensor histidine kinase [Nocardioides sp. GY 10127]
MTTTAHTAAPGSQDVDAARLEAVERYHVLLEPPRADLLALVGIAAQVARVPLATINLITDTEQHQIAVTGFEAAICTRSDSMCAGVLHEPEPVIVSDASLDPRFATNPFVTGELGDVRFYATHHLRTPSGVTIGTLCVFDTVPRSLDDEQEAALRELAARVVDVLELELRSRDLERSVLALEQAHAELERSNAQLTAFAGQVAHDLRNPLSAISMSLDLLDEGLTEDPRVDPQVSGELSFILRRAASGAGRMRVLIDDLLSYARLGGDLRRGPVDLGAVVAEVRTDLATALHGARVEVGPLPTVHGDRSQLRAVLQNLLANSAKFTAPGQPARIEVHAETGERTVRLEVVDHGLGIPEQDRARVFEPLARAHEEIAGTGIGLATVHRIVEAHRGAIGITGTPGGGTTVWVELPR